MKGLVLYDPQTFIAGEEERPVFYNRPANAETELVLPEWRFFCSIEEVFGVEHIVPEKLKDTTVKLICP